MQTEDDGRPAIPAEVVRAILIESGHRCAVCGEGCPIERAHIVPWNKSRDHSRENLICLCANCHQRADTEEWGAKTLREYKERPWIQRRFAGAEAPTETAKIIVAIDMDIEDYDDKQRRLLQFALASFLDIPPASVRVIGIESGSVKVKLLLPSEHVLQLVSAMDSGDPQLLAYLKPLKVTQLAVEPAKAEQAATVEPAKAEQEAIDWNLARKEVAFAWQLTWRELLEHTLLFMLFGVLGYGGIVFGKSLESHAGDPVLGVCVRALGFFLIIADSLLFVRVVLRGVVPGLYYWLRLNRLFDDQADDGQKKKKKRSK